jgi:hypothetical protein
MSLTAELDESLPDRGAVPPEARDDRQAASYFPDKYPGDPSLDPWDIRVGGICHLRL